MLSPATKARAFLQAHAAGTVATIAADGGPRARTIYYVADEAFKVYFLTLANTRKTADFAHDDRVAFVVSSEEPPQTLQLEGTIEDRTETAQIDDPMVRLLSDHMLKRGLLKNPVTRLDTGMIAYYCITPTFVRFGDFSNGYGAEAVFSELTP